MLLEVARRNRVTDGLLYMQVTRGVARRDHAFPHAGVPAVLVVTADAARACPATWTAGPPRPSPGPTSAGRAATSSRVALLPNVLAKQAAREAGAAEALLLDATAW